MQLGQDYFAFTLKKDLPFALFSLTSTLKVEKDFTSESDVYILYTFLGAIAPLGPVSSEGLYVCLYVCMSICNTLAPLLFPPLPPTPYPLPFSPPL